MHAIIKYFLNQQILLLLISVCAICFLAPDQAAWWNGNLCLPGLTFHFQPSHFYLFSPRSEARVYPHQVGTPEEEISKEMEQEVIDEPEQEDAESLEEIVTPREMHETSEIAESAEQIDTLREAEDDIPIEQLDGGRPSVKL